MQKKNNRQTGAATLLVSLIIASLISMLSIYTAQVSIIEQRISINHLYAQQAFEIAEIGLERVTTSINRDIIRQQAKKNEVGTIQTFSDADISISNSIMDRDGTNLGYFKFQFTPEENSWSTNLTIHSFSSSNSTEYPDLTVSQKIDFTPLIAQPTLSAIISKNNISIIGNTPSIQNFSRVSPITMWSGGKTSSTLSTPIQSEDQDLTNLTIEKFFSNFFTDNKVTLKEKSNYIIDCVEGCRSKDLFDENSTPLTGIIWIDTYNSLSNSYSVLNIENNITLGTIESPILIIVDGHININHWAANITGLLYTTQTFNSSGEGTIIGTLISEQNIELSGKIKIHYNHLVIENLIEDTGKFTRIAGSWRDF